MIEEQIKTFKEKVFKEISIIEDVIRLEEDVQRSKSEKDQKTLLSQIELRKTTLEIQKKEVNEFLTQLSLTTFDLEISENPQTKEKVLSDMSTGYNLLSNQRPPSSPLTRKDLPFLEKLSLKRVKEKKEVIPGYRGEKPSRYVNFAVRSFYSQSRKLIYGGMFSSLRKSLVRANMQFIPENYVSVMLFTTVLSIFISIFLFIFLLFFNISMVAPMISLAGEAIQSRMLKFLWIIFIIPLGTFFMLYSYPSLEKKSIEGKINQELPFVTIHMSSIAGAMKDPSKMFGIIISTREYPAIQKEFAKIINEIHIYGYDLVSALRNSAFNCPSRKLAELYNGISTTISSGGNLAEFFEKRAETLLFDYKIEREKYNKSTETFMDIYLSVVIAAPMILMLLLIIMRVSGLGISLSTPMISLVTILGVTVANIFFLIFLYIKQPAQ